MAAGLVGGGADGVVVLADHPLLLAVPFFVPALIVAAVIGHLVYRDRREAAREQAEAAGDGDLDRTADSAAVPPPRPAVDP